jgi:hypothetical protein
VPVGVRDPRCQYCLDLASPDALLAEVDWEAP